MSSKAVAEITADTMNNYLLMGHILQCHVSPLSLRGHISRRRSHISNQPNILLFQLVPQEKLHPDLWVGANKKWRRVPAARIERSTYGKVSPVVQTLYCLRLVLTKLLPLLLGTN